MKVLYTLLSLFAFSQSALADLKADFLRVANTLAESPALAADKIDRGQFSELLQSLDLEVSESPLYLDGVRKDAINFFPGKKRLILFGPRWEQFFREKRDVANLVYHELTPYFFGDDLQYRTSRAHQFNEPLPFTFSLAHDSYYKYRQDFNIECAIHLRFEKRTRKVVVTQAALPDSKLFVCAHGGYRKEYTCAGDEIKNCVASHEYQGAGLYYDEILSMEDQSSLLLGRIVGNKAEAVNDPKKDGFYVFRGSPNKYGQSQVNASDQWWHLTEAPELQIPESPNRFVAWWFHEGADLSYTDNCRVARIKAYSNVLAACESLYERCEEVKERAMSNVGNYGKNGCFIGIYMEGTKLLRDWKRYLPSVLAQ